ncbi:MAG: RdgB/HAM1 family non-canonical purine NTP pyrophosphatase [Actinomycetota bacterium]|nr:RdgB/HAM1 family non-canonical purine NTP pyrophosphatase [Actinomycetota bacterium]MDQ2956201.1 RdgB/HAM1 family non-canonical purine NTP pyrophosphatase [Actinomycetota bacterium]
MSARLLLATRNAHKLEELRRILAPRLSVEVLGLDDVPAFDEVPETGATFADNALLKAREAVRHTGLISVADDSGLAVDALNGMPGVLSARWSGPAAVAADGTKQPGADAANLNLLLAQVSDTPDERLGAAFHCAVALVVPGGAEIVRDGVMPGRLIRQPRGSNGFGYDPIFVPAGYQQTSAELPSADKDRISHRGLALQALLPELLAVLGG